MDPDAALRRIDGAPRIKSSSKARTANAHAAMELEDGHTFGIGDIVRRSDISTRNHYAIVNIKDPWIYTRRISGSGGPGIVAFPTLLMLTKVNP